VKLWCSVAADWSVRSDKNQLRAGRFGTGSAAEAGEDGEDRDVSDKNAEADRSEDREAEDEGHRNRIHSKTNLLRFSLT
jgi:hypothetical protein